MEKIMFWSFGNYGTNKHPVIYYWYSNSKSRQFIYMDDLNFAMNYLKQQIENAVAHEYTVIYSQTV